MKKMIALAVVAAFLIAIPALAGEEKKMEKGEMWAKGTITAWDDATKMMKVNDGSGKEMTISWNENTKVQGTAKIGEMVKVGFKKEKDMMMATHVYVGKENIEKAGMDH